MSSTNQDVTVVAPRVSRVPFRAMQMGKRQFLLRRLLAAADMLAMAVALALVALVFERNPGYHLVAWLVLLPLWVLVFKLYGLYDRDVKRVSHSTVDDVPWLFHALLAGAVVFWSVLAAVPSAQPRISAAGAVVGAGLVLVFAFRAAVRSAAARIVPAERVLFVGGGPIAHVLADKIRSHREYGINPVGYVDIPERGSAALARDVPYLGTVAELEMLCREQAIERIVIASPELADEDVPELIRLANSLDVRVCVLPHFFDVLGPSVTIDHVEGVTVLGLNAASLSPSSLFLKRALDLVLAVPALIVASLLIAGAAVAVKLTSSGPVFFRQDRIGRAGRRFRIYKLRTMVADADGRAAELKSLSKHPAWLLLEHDPRITRVGAFLRRTSLDELPQLWNVVRGDMSLVGPRPMTPDVDERISGWGRRRLDLTPGITGLWQVLGRTNIPFEEMVKLDYVYVTNWSLWQDVRLLIQTLPAVLRGRGVN
jgi:exopolysaccharide biosynthesis polyprenyl glycosylphosphotransferase